jgi:DNA-binding transcriptional LysR family regulator
MEVFHAIYVNGTVVGAAKVLNVSQPSISKVLAHAEVRLGFLLFRRLRGRLVPTDEAHVLHREIIELEARVSSVRQTAKNLRNGIGGYLRLALLPSLGLFVAPEAIASLLRSRPTINVDVQTLHHDDILRSLIERDSELAVGFEAPSHPRVDGRQIGQGELVVFFPKELLPNPTARVSLAHFTKSRLITLANSGPVGNLFSNETSSSDLDFEEQISVRTFYVAAGLVRAGAGIAVIDEFTARATLVEGLDFRPLDPPISFGIHAIYLVDRPPSKPADEFIACLSRVLKDEAVGYNDKL